MSISCYCDFDPATLYFAEVVTARKPHRCDECTMLIAPGERYERAKMLADGHWSVFATCADCLPMAEWVSRNCGCRLHGDLWRHLEEDTWGEYRHELPAGVAFKVGRWIIGKRRRTGRTAVTA